MKKTLPFLNDMIFPSFLTFHKGVKINKEGIYIEKYFENVTIDKPSLKSYKEFFDWKEEFPLAFFYLMAQRAQTALMLDTRFTIAVPGLVHIANNLTQLASINYNEPFDIKTNVNVEYKDTGSLIPKFTVDFVQNNILVIHCESTYIAKRKSNKKKSSMAITDDIKPQVYSYSENWEIATNLGRKYATASGDKNPIHSSKFFAKLIGFRNPILQGWYSVSRVVKQCESDFNTTYKNIQVEFKSPIFLPSKQIAEWYVNDLEEVIFQVKNQKTNKLVLNGKLK